MLKLYLFYRKYNHDISGNSYYIVDLFEFSKGQLFDVYHLLKRTAANNDLGRVSDTGAIVLTNNHILALESILNNRADVLGVQKIRLYN